MKRFIAYGKLLFFFAAFVLGDTLSISGQVKPSAATAPPVEAAQTPPTAYPSSMPINYIRTWTPDMPSTDPAVVTSPSRTTSEVKQITQYFDGLGRPLQSVTKQISPTGRDMVTPVIYDQFGRETYKYLPYPQTTGNTNDGEFKQDPFNSQKTAIDNQNLYPGENIYYGKVDYESSPLDRVLKTMAPGNSWTGSERGISQSYEINTAADSVRIWEIDSPAGSLPENDFYYYDDQTYPLGMLYKNITTDEGGNRTATFTDMQGHLILKKTALSNEPAGAHAGWLCTYYVYDNTGNLRFVIPPLAVEYLQSHSWALSQTIADELCFRYEYDGRNRTIIKKVPGGAETYMVYDNRDRLVFTQDGNQRSSGQWLVTYYDAMNRPVETGIYSNSSATQASLQSLMNEIAGGLDNIPAPFDLEVNNRQGNTPAVYTARNSITFLPGFTSGDNDAFSTNIDPNAMESSGTAVPGDSTNPLPPISQSAVTPLTYTFYDDYDWNGNQAFQSSYLSKTTAAGNSYAESPSTYSDKTKGKITGSKIKVLGNEPALWLTTTIYYDDKGRMLQTLSGNITGGTDAITNKYDFSGKLLSSYIVNHNNQSTVTPETRVLTENLYDAAGRLETVSKTINDVASSKKVIVTNTYDELGRLIKKSLGRTPSNPLDTVHYDYNIRGWMSGINKPYVNNTSTVVPAPGRYFGMELSYDYGFTQNQYDGNISGEKWRTSGDGERRAYGFSYDPANRLTEGDFTQYTSGTWGTSAGVDYTVSNLAYDANGNIKSMKQMGLISTTSGTVDNLTYTYQNGSYSNRLDNVADNGGTTAKLSDFKDAHTGTGDYTYDLNGNLTKDLNKAIGSITYNYLNLPENITVTGKGTIQFVYDATGNKLRKIVTDNTTSTATITTTDYIGGFIYQHIGGSTNDTLQFFSTEEGRVRYVPAHGSTAAGYLYDYFLKDHLGNTRVVLTEQTDFSQYMATMEQPNAQTEDALFYNLDNTRATKPVDYPQDNTTTPNTAVAKLSGDDPNKRIGPSIILKVMAGDTIQAAVKAFYRQPATPKNNPGLPAEQMMAGLLQALVAPSAWAIAAHSVQSSPETRLAGSGLTAGDLEVLKQKRPEQIKSNRPKAYLNYVFFDNQLKFVKDGSGVKQVNSDPGQLETLSSGRVVAKKTGYVYVYISNESQQDVLFDNLGVLDITGPVLEETHYYPFGLTMSGISTTAPLKLEGRRKFNGIEFNHKEFSDGSGLDLYTAKFRGLDPQIGRWWQIDPKPNKMFSPYTAMSDNPIKNIDFLGDTLIVTGEDNAKKRFIQINNEGLGGFYKTNISKNGTVTLTKTNRKGDMTKGQEAFHKEESGIISLKETTKVGLVQNDKTIIGGSFKKGKIDVGDIAQFKGKKVSAASTMAHEIVEQYNKQINGMNYNAAHVKGLEAEQKITGYTRDIDYQITNIKPDPDGGVTGVIKLHYMKGPEIKTVNIYIKNSNVIKVEQ